MTGARRFPLPVQEVRRLVWGPPLPVIKVRESRAKVVLCFEPTYKRLWPRVPEVQALASVG